MSLTPLEIRGIIGEYSLGYSDSSIMTAMQCVLDIWGRDFLESFPRSTPWYLTELIDLGLMIDGLKELEGSKELFDRLLRKERAAFSGARLAAYFSKLGYEVKLEPRGAAGRFNDLAVKHGDDWINFEVKTPSDSEIKRILDRRMFKILNIAKNVESSRDINICLAGVPSEEELELITSTMLQLVDEEKQPKQALINEIAWIRTEYSTTQMIREEKRWCIPVKTDYFVPPAFSEYYPDMPALFHIVMSWGKDRRVGYVHLTVPFEDDRLLEFIRTKSKQLSRDMHNIVALDISDIELFYPEVERRMMRLEAVSLYNEVSRRIGAILLFNKYGYGGKIHLESIILEHPEPYMLIPNSFLDECNLEDYSNVIET